MFQRSKSDRVDARAQVIPKEIRGLMTKKSEGAHKPFLIWDVSTTGLGLWVSEPLTVGEAVVLTIGQPFLSVMSGTVVWCEEMGSDQGFRCGVEIVDDIQPLNNLITAFMPPTV